MTSLAVKPNKIERSEPNLTDQSSLTDCRFLTDNNIKSRIDFLKLQFKTLSRDEFDWLLEKLTQYLFGLGIKRLKQKPGSPHFEFGEKLQTADRTRKICGSLKWKSSQRVLQLEMTGVACNYANTHEQYFFPLLEFAKHFEVIIKRIDIAVDSFTKTHSFRFMQQSLSKGDYFPKSGKKPGVKKHKNDEGRTITIGSLASNKIFNGYEKGKYEGYPKNSVEYDLWCRHEVKLFGRKNYVIPLDVILNPDEYFVGAFPRANRKVLKGVPARCIKREVIKNMDSTMRKKVEHAKNFTGLLFDALKQRGLNDSKIVNIVRRSSERNRLNLPSFISEADLENYPFKP